MLLAGLAAAVALAGCGGSGSDENPSGGKSSPTARKTGGPATAPGILKAEGYVLVPRTNVALRPPDGFVVAASLPGLARKGTRSTFLVSQAATPYDDPEEVVDEVETGFNDEAATTQKGLELSSVKRLSIDGRPAVGATGTQTAGGLAFNKAIVTFPSEGFLVTVSATLAPDDPVSAADALAILRGARWSTRGAAGNPGFVVRPAAGYVKQAASGGLSYTLGGRLGPGVPAFLVNRSLGGTPTPRHERRDVARARFGAFPGNPRADSEEPVTISGLAGWEFTGTGKEGGRERRYYAAVLFTDEGYLALVGTFDPASYSDQTDAFRSMARSLELTDR